MTIVLWRETVLFLPLTTNRRGEAKVIEILKGSLTTRIHLEHEYAILVVWRTLYIRPNDLDFVKASSVRAEACAALSNNDERLARSLAAHMPVHWVS